MFFPNVEEIQKASAEHDVLLIDDFYVGEYNIRYILEIVKVLYVL